jgi:hypothetical protein
MGGELKKKQYILVRAYVRILRDEQDDGIRYEK